MVKQVYNTKDISNIALASMRHHTGLRETAEIATSAWIDACLISAEYTHLVIYHIKLKRAQDKLYGKFQVEFENNLEKMVSIVSYLMEEKMIPVLCLSLKVVTSYFRDSSKRNTMLSAVSLVDTISDTLSLRKQQRRRNMLR